MRRTINFIAPFFLVSVFIFFSSCTLSNTGDNFSQSKYTVMIYGAGGGNLDNELLQNLCETEANCRINGFDKNQINITAQFNMSDIDANTPKKDIEGKIIPEEYEQTPYQKDGSEYKGTMRWYMTENGWNKENNFSQVQMLHNPDVLTDFINFSVNKFPADKYILIFNNHGSSFSITDQPVDSPVTKENGSAARAVIFDTNNSNQNRPLSIFGIEEGIKNSNAKMELIYFDCCKMGQVEMLYQIKDVTNYVISSSNVSYSVKYHTFFECLKNYSFIAGMREYLKETSLHWKQVKEKPNSSTGYDIVLSDMSKMENFADSFINVKNYMMKIFFEVPLTQEAKESMLLMFRPKIDQLKFFIDEDKISEDWKHGFFYYYDFGISELNDGSLYYKDYTAIDLRTSFNLFGCSTEPKDGEFLVIVDKMLNDLDKVIIASESAYVPEHFVKPSLSLVLIDKKRYEEDKYLLSNKEKGSAKYSTLKSIYPLLEWDKKTHWSEFFEKNTVPDYE